MKNDILQINALLKNIEFLLHLFETTDEKISLKELRKKFKDKFSHNDALLNQYFGIIRLMPLILIKQEYRNQNKKIENNIQKIKIIREAISHNNFSIKEDGYFFSNDKGNVKMTFQDFQKFLYEIENDFYKNHESPIPQTPPSFSANNPNPS